MPKIMILEDDKQITTALRLRLRKAGFEVCTAEDAVVAARVAVKEDPDLAILDISVPGGNGFIVAERLQQLDSTAGIPMIFLTASRQPGLADRAAEQGASAFLLKPYDFDELLSHIESALSQTLTR